MAYTKVKEDRFVRAKMRLQGEKKGWIYQNGWVLLFIVVCALTYFHFTEGKNVIIRSLDQHLGALKMEKSSLLDAQEDLLLQIHSQSDPAWIRLTLMKGLGLVPEGQLKVYFYGDND
jgi:hypothetical protein